MEIADVRKRVLDTMERAKRHAAERRAETERVARAYDTFLSRTAIPLVRQVVNVLKAEGYAFSLFTPTGSVRIMSDRNAEDFIEITLDSSADGPRVVAQVSRSRGRRVVDAEQVVGSGNPETITDVELLGFLMTQLEPFVER